MPSAHALGLGDVRLKLTRPICLSSISRTRGFEPLRVLLPNIVHTRPSAMLRERKPLDSSAITRAKQLSEQYIKPIVFTEFSLNSYKGATHYQLQKPPDYQVDLQEQANQFEGIMQAEEERPWIAGMHV